MSVNKSKIFDAKEIRDTNSYNGEIVFQSDFILKTVIIENNLNQLVTLQCEGSTYSDFSKKFNIGNPFETNANTIEKYSYDCYVPYFRLKATCSVAPATGSLTAMVFSIK